MLLCVAGAILLLVRRLTAPATVSKCDPEWVANFSITTYRPMLRLLDEEDFRFLAAQPGVSAATIRELRRERRRVFRAYLRNMVRDFHRLHLAARMSLLYATEDRSDLAHALFRQRITFTGAVLQVEFRLLLHAAGLAPVDVTRLLGALDSMRLNVSALNAVPQAGY
jgi:uncharacterized protein (DUF1810 family)